MPRGLVLRHRQHGDCSMRRGNDHRKHWAEHLHVMCCWQLPVREWRDCLCRLPGGIVLSRACHLTDGVQPGRLHRHDRAECLRPLLCGLVSIGERCDGVRHVSGRGVLRARCRGVDCMRCGQLPQRNGRRSAERLHDVPCWIRMPHGRRHADCVRAGHDRRRQWREYVCQLSCRQIPSGRGRD